jgi:long-chain acyl-CoA synthetase
VPTPPRSGFLQRVESGPAELALDDGERRRSWAELLDRVTRLRNLLRDELGLVPGDHVASMLGNRVEWFELTLATMAAGVWLVPVNTHLQPDEIAYVLSDSAAAAVFADGAHLDAARGGRARVIEVGAEHDAAVKAASARPIDWASASGGRMHYTSGTTGRPKGVKRALPATAGEYLERLGALGDAVGLDGSGPHLLTGPHYHAAVGGYALFDLCNGAAVHLMERFDALETVTRIARDAIAHTHLVPTMMVRLLRLPAEQRAAFDPSSLTMVLHGAAPISMSTKRAMIDWWGPVFTEYWGTSEAGTFTLIDSADWLAHPGSVGRALPGVEIVAVDEDGRMVKPGEVGTLYCRLDGSLQPFRYYGDDDKTAAAFLAPGLFTMGDMGRIDAEGFVHLVDRATNMIISGGVNIYPAEVEAVVLAHDAVADVAVFGIPDEEWGEQVKAAVELAPGFTGSDVLADEIVEFVRAHIAHYKAPRTIDFVDVLPRLPTGKLLVRTLRDPYWSDRERRI